MEKENKIRIFYFFVYLGLFFAIYFLNTKILQLSFIPSSSMEPTLNIGDFVVGNRLNIDEIKRYDVITFEVNDKVYIKRVIGLPNERIKISTNGNVYINGNKTRKDFIKEKPNYKHLELKIPNDSVFLMGDNRNNSKDSRYFGSIKIENIVSKAWFKLSPTFKKIK